MFLRCTQHATRTRHRRHVPHTQRGAGWKILEICPFDCRVHLLFIVSIKNLSICILCLFVCFCHLACHSSRRLLLFLMLLLLCCYCSIVIYIIIVVLFSLVYFNSISFIATRYVKYIYKNSSTTLNNFSFAFNYNNIFIYLSVMI